MSMVTSCPACTTTFRITPEQLKQREGKVRCGKCSGVFDAFKSLATLPDETLPAAAAEALPVSPAASASTPARAAAPETTGRQGALDIDAVATVDVDGKGGAGSGSKPRALRWALLAVLVLLLALQLAYLLRDQLSAAVPPARPWFERLCRHLGCTVSFPRRSEQLAIEASDLQADPARPNVIVLTASLRNRGSTVVAHPALELTLTNAQDQALARRIFLPADYLQDPAAADRGMAGMAAVDVRIALDTGDLKPAGYRLFLFYP
jgi:predicted Zn finger-like uncharacterized protein